MSKHVERESQKSAGSTGSVENLFKQVAVSVIVAMITAKITAFIIDWALLQKVTVILQFAFLILIPFLLRKGFSRVNMPASRTSIIILSIIFIASFSAFFSMFPGSSLPKPPNAEFQSHNVFTDDHEYLRGSGNCRPSCLNRLRVDQDKILTVREQDGSLGPAHILLDVEWDKWERVPFLQRNYKGTLYYRVQYQCDNSTAKPQINKQPELLGYQLRPGRIVLSWLIGFIEIPFVLDTEKDIPRRIQEALQSNSEICTLYNREA